VPDITAAALSIIKLPNANTFTKSGYAFAGWNTEAGGTGTDYNAGDTFTVPANNITLYAKWNAIEGIEGMVRINAGTFMMGSPESEPGRPNDDSIAGDNEIRHQVTLTKGFYMARYPVTQAQYEAVMGENPSVYRPGGAGAYYVTGLNTGTFPVENVSWYDALVFCNKLSVREGLTPAYSIEGSTDPADWWEVPTYSDETWNAVTIVADSTGYRLPTEAQWEYACRAGTTTAFNWGTNNIDDSKANYDAGYVDDMNTVAGTYLQRTTGVGTYAANAWGLYDMHGNVWEWCWSGYGNHSGEAQTDPEGQSTGYKRIWRGGSFYHYGKSSRSAARGYKDPYVRLDYIGFRIIRPE
jgi:uncharacterized repeat protein (TIGR02543 family)